MDDKNNIIPHLARAKTKPNDIILLMKRAGRLPKSLRYGGIRKGSWLVTPNKWYCDTTKSN